MPLPVSMADVLYEVDEPIYQLQDPPSGEKEETIAGYVTEMMKDGDCIQLGFGGIPNAIGFHLMEKHDLGIHTEQIGTSMAHLMACGAVTNRYKSIDQGITVGSFISGDNFLYDFVDQHPPAHRPPRDRYTNDPYVIARNDNVVSVNASLQIDLTGQVCAGVHRPLSALRHRRRHRLCLGAYHSGGPGHPGLDVHHEEGDPLPHCAHPGPGAIVSVSRNLTDMVVTEYGVAKLRQRTVGQRVENLIAVAHPDFRAELRKQAAKYMYY